MKKLAIIAASAALGACAAKPESIAPQYVSHMTYMNWTCQQMAEETNRINAALASASAQQNSARSNDVAGVILIGLPVSSMSGENVAPQIALYKGQIQALYQAANLKNCGWPPPAAPTPAE